jgi:hypothetical protein
VDFGKWALMKMKGDWYQRGSCTVAGFCVNSVESWRHNALDVGQRAMQCNWQLSILQQCNVTRRFDKKDITDE